MINSARVILCLFLISQLSLAQTADSSISSNNTLKKSGLIDSVATSDDFDNQLLIKPTIGLGVGMFSFYGDVLTKKFQKPTVSRIAYNLSVSQAITKKLDLSFNVIFGKLGANERLSPNNRNLNFESEIRAGGVSLSYNFIDLTASDRFASPFISAGIESFEFLSKTDAFDKFGNEYFYWADGSIRNIAENSTNANSATEIYRDYSYESDIREMDLDSFGKYQERSFAIPIGIGLNFKLNDYLNFKLGTTYHLTFTDYIDGVTSDSKGSRKGNSKNDNFLMSYCSISYNFGNKEEKDDNINEQYDGTDFLAIDLGDYDGDGVVDFIDECQGTPAGVDVDSVGCPFDDDDDNYPNYKDDEIMSTANSFVDVKGVELSAQQIEEIYHRYIDSTMSFAQVDFTTHKGTKPTIDPSKKVYSVDLGTFEKGLPADLMTKFLSIQDITTNNRGNSTTTYTAGKYDNLAAAESRIQELIENGLTDLKIVYKKGGTLYDVNPSEYNSSPNSIANSNRSNPNQNEDITSNKTGKNTTSSQTTIANKSESGNSQEDRLAVSGVVLRIQLGAYSKPISKNVFKGISDLIVVKTDDGLYKYMTGSHSNFEAAAKHKLKMVVDGYEGAFITAYNDGKRVTLKEAGATPAIKGDKLDTQDDNQTIKIRKDLVKFKVQIGVFRNQPPNDKLAIFAKLDNLIGEKTKSGLTRYVVGSFDNYNEAQAYKKEINTKYGLSDAFVVALFNNDYISIQEAIELLK